MADELQGRKVAVLLAPKGTEQDEFVQPKQAVEGAGASVDVVGVQGSRGTPPLLPCSRTPGRSGSWHKKRAAETPSSY
jgi:putative intracellular protease/amidase